MRFLHTADWHLGLRLGAYDLTDRQFAQIERLLEMGHEKGADVLLVAGDVFEKRTQLATLTKRLVAVLKPHLERGLHVILVPGNHDDREHFRMMHSLLDIEGHTHHLHIVETRCNLEICGVQWGILPYPDRDTLSQYANEKTGKNPVEAADRNEVDSTGYAPVVRAVASQFKSHLPAVLVAHITVQGVETPSELELSYNQDLILGRNTLPQNVNYIALGHIHQCQQIVGDVNAPCYYSGNLDRYNRGERHDERKGAYLVEISDANGDGTKAKVEWLDLPVTPFHDIAIRHDDIESLPQKYPDLNEAFVHITLDCTDCEDPIRARRLVYELCPRVLDVVTTGATLASLLVSSPSAPRDWRQTAINHINEVHAGENDLPALQDRTIILLGEVENALTSP